MTDEGGINRRSIFRVPQWMVLLLVLTGVFHALFIASTSKVIGGERYFVLFDDAAISMRYAENLAGGHGLVWNSGGTPVEGITNPLWTAWMAALHLVGLPRPVVGLAVMITSSVLLLTCVVLAAGVARRLAPELRAAPPAAAVLTAAAYPLAYWSLRGMEVGAVAAASLGGVILALDWAEAPEDRRATLHTIGALTLVMVATRLDAAVLALPLMAWCFSRGHQRRVAVVLGSWFFGGVAVMTAARLAYFGDLLPNTYYLKATGVPLGTRIGYGAGALGDAAAISLIVPLAVAAAGVAWAVASRLIGVVALPVSMLATQLAYSVWTGGDAWEALGYANRYVATILPLLAVLGGIGVAALARLPSRELRPVAVAVVAVTALGCAFTAAWEIDELTAAVAGNWQPWRSPVIGIGWGLFAVGLGLVAFWTGAGAVAPTRSSRRAAVGPGERALVVGILALGVVLAANGNAAQRWLRDGPGYLGVDARWAEDGLMIGACTRPDAVVGVFAAGQIIYYADRPGVDLLGKADRTIARMDPPAGAAFRPGHNKYSYERSVALRPDLITDAGLGMPSDMVEIAERAGYERLGRWLVHRDARNVDREGLARAMAGGPSRCRPRG